MLSWEALTILLGGVATLAIFSFVAKENALYRLFEHIFIGIAAGLGLVVSIKSFIWPRLLKPMLGLDITMFPDGTPTKEYDPLNLLYLIPMAFGALYYFIYSKRYGWIAKIVIGFTLGISGGIAFKGFFNEMLPQLSGSFKSLLVFSEGNFDFHQSVSNFVFVATLLIVMYYFFFSFKIQRQSSSLIVTGRWLMMISFGAFFGSTVMARMALLVERLQFLMGDWFVTLRSVVGV